ncbi:MAG: hypothetical protein ACP5L4_01155 [Thermoplasmata archaeon]
MNQLTKGSKIKLYFMNEAINEIDGIFEGFINLGEDSAILVKSAENEKYKVIPTASVAYIDIMELFEEKKEDESNKNVTYFA